MKNILIIIIFTALTSSLFSQETYTDEKRAIYVLYLSKNIKWNNDSTQTKFKIGIFAPKESVYENMQKNIKKNDSIYGKKIQLSYIKNIKDLNNFQVIYIHRESKIPLEKIFEATKGEQTLIISEGYEFSKSMIMLVEVEGKRRYAINPKTIKDAGMFVPELFLASALKTREQWEGESKNAKSLLSKQNQKVREQKKEIHEQKKEIRIQQARINKQIDKLKKLQEATVEQDKKLHEKLAQLEEKRQKVQAMNILLNSQEKKLEKQKSKINKQLEKIEKQKIFISFSILLILLVGLVVFFVYRGYKIKKAANKELKEKNNAIIIQNQEILQHKEEIEAQRDHIEEQKYEIEKQRDFVVKQRDLILGQKREITDSIHYASRIQIAVLPPQNMIEKLFHDYFVLFLPRDIVSGDYYWIKKINTKIFAIAADCTGHGVPGAFMSMLGISLLNDIVNFDMQAYEILNRLRTKIIELLHQTGKEGEAKDGMDISLSVIDEEKRTIQFSGAYNHLYLFRDIEKPAPEIDAQKIKIETKKDRKIIQIKADRMPIGIYLQMKPFTQTEFPYYSGDTIYMLSDGYVDQFGGEDNEKFKSRRFKNLLAEIQKEDMKTQKNILEKRIGEWRGEHNQIDDIVIVGINLK